MRSYWILFFLFPAFLMGIDVRTNIKDVHHEGCCEQIGSFSLSLRDNAFSTASYNEPVYIRFKIVRAHGWSKTLVDLRPDADPQFGDPINLAIRTEGLTIIAPDLPRDAVQLVRLIAGEREGWLRINVSTDLWLFEEGVHTSPNNDDMASFSIGISALSSVITGSSTPTNGNEFHNSQALASTVLCANYTDTPNFAVGDLDSLDFISFDFTTTGVETGDTIQTGANAGVTFSDDTDIARGAHHIACFDMTTEKGNSESPPHDIQFSKLSAIDLRYGCESIPDLFITNCSDYEWHPGSQFFFCLTSVKLSGDTFVEMYSGGIDNIYFNQPNLNITAAAGETWQITPGYIDGKIVGYQLTLTEGNFPVDGSLTVSNLSVCVDNDFTNESLNFYTFADITNPEGTNGNLIRYGSFIAFVAELSYAEKDLYHRVIPYTGYDQESWQFTVQSINLSSKPSRLTTYLSNRHGLLLRIQGMQEIPPLGTHHLSIKETYGEEADRILAWVEQYSDKPFQSTGILMDPGNEVLEIIESREKSWNKLIAPHITSSPEWHTTAYILASGSDSPRFFFNIPGETSQHITAIRYPGATAVYEDDDFINNGIKMSWFQVDAESSTANGQILYYKNQGGGQLASIALGGDLQTTWEFDHLGKNSAGWWNGVVINNPNTVSTVCILSIHSENNDSLDQVQIEIDPEKREAFLLQDYFHDTSAIEASRLVIESEEPTMSFLLMGMESKDQLTDVPGNMMADKKLLLPYLNCKDDFWTGLVIANVGDQEASFYFEVYESDGSMRQSSLVEIPFQGKAVFLVEDYLQNLSESSYMIVYATRDVRGFALIGNRSQTELASLPLIPIP